MARLEKRPVDAKILAEAFEPERVQPLSSAHFLHVPTGQHAVGLYQFPGLGMPVGVLLPRQADNEAKTAKPRQFAMGEGSGSQGPDHQKGELWDND